MKKLLLFILILILIPLAYSVGVSPAETNINFQPNLETDITYRLRSNMDSPMYVYTQLVGDLAQYATISDEQVFINPGEYGRVVVHLKLPEKIDTPGYNTIQFLATESKGTGGSVGARGAVVSPIQIFVQYPGKYLQISLEASDAKLGGDAKFTVNLNNLGTERVNSAKAVIDIYEDKKKIASVNTDEKPVEVFGKATLSASWNTKGKNPGNYRAVANVQYDEKTGTAEDAFKIGILAVRILNFTEEVYEKKVNKFGITVESEWNDPVENLFADIRVLKDGSEKTAFTASEKTLEPWKIKAITGYLDAGSIQAGIYDVSILLTFNEIGSTEQHSTAKNGTIEVLKSAEEQQAVSVGGIGKYLTTTNILLFILILLVLFNLLRFFMKRKDEKQTEI